MKKNILFLSLIFIGLQMYSQNRYTKNCSLIQRKTGGLCSPNDSLESGEWKMYYEDDSTLYGVFLIKNGMKDGKFSLYYKSGAKLVEGEFNTDTLFGSYKSFLENGNKWVDIYIGGDSINNKYWNQEGELVSKSQFELLDVSFPYYIQDSIKTGIDKDGVEIRYRGDSYNGVRHGFWQVFDRFGVLIEEGQYNNGLKCLAWRYFKNGKLVRTGSYNYKGMKSRMWLYYNPEGIILKKEIYVNGVLK